MAFRLRKWYLDAIDPHGNTFIGYWASVEWGWLHLHYTASLQLTNGEVQSTSSFRRATEPVQQHRQTTWNTAEWQGTWNGDGDGFSAVLYQEPLGSVQWHCLLPHATVKLQRPSGELLGLGYVERLEMTVPPWKLPIDELRWGRWLSHEQSLVWIHWQSTTHPRQLAWRNGSPLPLHLVNDNQVLAGDIALDLNESIELRQGPLGRTVFHSGGWWRWLLPRRLQQLRETKRRAEGILHAPYGNTHTGWALHEVVNWQ
jgi:hypothetical protein